MEIRRAKISDKRKIIDFIRNYWDKNHIFVKCEELFDFQYLIDEYINFIVAIDNDEIISILGHINYSQEYNGSDLFLAMWMTSPKANNSNIGIKLNKFLLEGDFRSVSCCGISKKVVPIYRFLGYKTGKLKHYYMINPEMTEFTIAKVENRKAVDIACKENIKLVKLDSFTELKSRLDVISFKDRYFYKDAWYIEKRYFNHPVYKYLVFGVEKQNKIESIIITREIEHKNSKALRVIDFIGNVNDLKDVGEKLNKILISNNYEYIDFYQYGIEDEMIEQAGFSLRDEKDKNIIPNYFEPFEQRNVDIYFATNVVDEKIYMFKGDGDQDRPNMLPEEFKNE